MAKKLNAKEKRLQQENERKEKIRKQDEERKKADEAARIKAEEEAKRRAEELARIKAEQEAKRQAEAEKELMEKRKKELASKVGASKGKKSMAKAAGLKSAFIIDNDTLLITSFGKGNQAILEHDVHGEEISKICDEPTLEVTPSTKKFDIQGRKLKASTDDPRCSYSGDVKQDLIGAKEILEKKFFGASFSDTIHVQLAYNILDIEKILSLHINNIVYSINNMLGAEGEEYDDFVGYMSLSNSYEDFINPDASNKKDKTKKKLKKLLEKFDSLLDSPRIGYFGSAFCSTGNNIKAKIRKTELRDERDIYHMLALIGEMRQSLAHADRKPDPLYNLEGNLKPKHIYESTRKMLDNLYQERVQALNKDFVDHAKKDLTIIFKMFGVTEISEKERLAKLYYDFVVRKTSKNMGFSLKKLRERIVEISGEDTQAEAFSSVRQKFYKILDFIIFEKYYYDTEATERNVAELRSTISDLEKEMFYEKEAMRLWNDWARDTFAQIKIYVKGSEIKNLAVDKDVSSDLIYGATIDEKNTCYFSKMIYMFTLFIDGKEINDLLTTLVNKFDNIASLIDVMKQKDIACEFASGYKMFNRSAAIVEELREINSFARMEKPHPSASMKMFCDAAKLLGANASEQELTDYFNQLLGKAKGTKIKTDAKEKKNTSLRNFIANNVLESDRFAYLVRYSKIENVRKLAQNRVIVEFVLNEIPDKQIERYCKACGKAIQTEKSENVTALSEIITGMNFEQFKGVDTKAKKGTKEGEEKQRLQSVISLYLTVLYIITKNLVYVNARYFMAFHSLERDARLLGIAPGASYTGLTEAYIAGRKEAKTILDKNTVNIAMNLGNIAGDVSLVKFRDCVMHIGAVRNADIYMNDVKTVNSYFELYHYLTQRHIEHLIEIDTKINAEEVSPKIRGYFALVNKSGKYCKDFVKALTVPFGYNVPRYKNLSVEGLFDKNRPWKKPEEEENDN